MRGISLFHSWVEILRRSTPQNDIRQRVVTFCERFFKAKPFRMTLLSSRTQVRDLIPSALFGRRFFGVIPLRMTLHHKNFIAWQCHFEPRPTVECEESPTIRERFFGVTPLRMTCAVRASTLCKGFFISLMLRSE